MGAEDAPISGGGDGEQSLRLVKLKHVSAVLLCWWWGGAGGMEGNWASTDRDALRCIGFLKDVIADDELGEGGWRDVCEIVFQHG